MQTRFPTAENLNDLEVEASPAPESATNRVRTLLLHDGPYTSVYLGTRPLLRGQHHDLTRRWTSLRYDLEAQCAPLPALTAIEDRLGMPMPEDTAAIGVIAAADGTSVVDYALEPPRRDFGTVETLPYLAPLFEWEQRRVPHLMVSAAPRGADIVSFTGQLTADLTPVSGSLETMSAEIARQALDTGARIVVIGGDPSSATRLQTAVSLLVHPTIRVIVEEGGIEEFAEATVRHVSDTVARETVGYFRELRFERSHREAVDGTASTLAALRAGVTGTLLVHDDPSDPRRVWVGNRPTDVSISPFPGHDRDARLVDAAICAGVELGCHVHIIPSTGSNGPDDGAALVRTRHPSQVQAAATSAA